MCGGGGRGGVGVGGCGGVLPEVHLLGQWPQREN